MPRENRNLVVLAMAMLGSAIIAACIGWMERPAGFIEKKPVYLADQTPVRLVGAPFVPNTNPRER